MKKLFIPVLLAIMFLIPAQGVLSMIITDIEEKDVIKETAINSEVITTESLLKEMTNLEGLMIRPKAGESAGQFSSYDRSSKIVDGNKVDWFANGDANNYVRTYKNGNRTEMVLAEMDGPGALTRIWSANPQGTLRIYIDGSEVPEIEGSFSDLATGKGGVPFQEPFSGVRARGCNIYFPIPFKESILVTVQNPGSLYYHINYRKFPDRTKVESFSMDNVLKLESLIMETADILSDPYGSWKLSEDAATTQISEVISPAQSKLISIDGPAAIEAIELSLTGEDMEKALRNTLIRITWDDYAAPSVWSPLGDFFGSAPGFNEYEGLPSGMLSDGRMYSHWVMPFKSKAKIEIINEGDKPVTIEGYVAAKPIVWDNSYMYFHAKWRADNDMPSSPHKDWPVLEAKGPGRFVGLSLSVANPSFWWWGEGDEKIYIDGEDFPSTFGTGTEDYFGYAWCDTALFTHAYHNQPRADGPDSRGHISNNRFHIPDNIMFQESIRFDLETWHWDGGTKVDYAAIAYWYTSAVNQDFYTPIPVEERRIKDIPLIVILDVEGAIEGEDMTVDYIYGGSAAPQGMLIFGTDWSGGKQMWWQARAKGNVLKLKFPVEEAGRYSIEAALTRAGDYGIFDIEINGQKLKEAIDLYDIFVTKKVFNLGEFDLNKGTNAITITVTGKNSRSTGYYFGLDYLLLREPTDSDEPTPVQTGPTPVDSDEPTPVNSPSDEPTPVDSPSVEPTPVDTEEPDQKAPKTGDSSLTYFGFLVISFAMAALAISYKEEYGDLLQKKLKI